MSTPLPTTRLEHALRRTAAQVSRPARTARRAVFAPSTSAPRDCNPLTDRERREIHEQHRGRPLGRDEYRNFCDVCGLPLVVPASKRHVKGLLCGGKVCRDEEGGE